ERTRLRVRLHRVSVAAMTQLSLTLDDRFVIGEREIEQLYQAVLFYADRVAIRSTATMAGGSAAPHIERKLAELRELKLLLTWEHEYEVGREHGADTAGVR